MEANRPLKNNGPKDAKAIAMVCSTYDYDWFKFIDGNRKPDHVNALIQSFRRRDVPNAILCNQNGEIIDGQNRFLARKQEGLPIYYYCIENLDIYDVACLNSYGKNWSVIDYVKMWADLGKEQYNRIFKFREIYPDFSIGIILQIIRGRVRGIDRKLITDDALRKNVTKSGGARGVNLDIQEGNLEDWDWDNACYIANCLLQYKPFARPGAQIYNSQLFVAAVIRLLRSKDFDNAEMVKKITKFPDMFHKCINAENYILMLTDIWNYKRGEKTRIARFE